MNQLVRTWLSIGIFSSWTAFVGLVGSYSFAQELPTPNPPVQSDVPAVESGREGTNPPPVPGPVEDLPIPGAEPVAPGGLQLAPPAGPATAGPAAAGPNAPSRGRAPIVITPRKNTAGPSSAQAPKGSPIAPAPASGPAAEQFEGGGYLGLIAEPVQGGGFGLAVVDVTNQSPAWKAGFRIGDRIVGVGGQAVTNLDQFANELERYAPGSPVKFLVQRRGRSTNLVAVLQDRTLAGQLQGMQPGTALPLQPPIAPTPNTQVPKQPYQPISPELGGDVPQVATDRGNVFLGVSVTDLSETFRKQFGIPLYRGAAVSDVVQGSTAELAGLQPGDCISEIDGRMILRAEDVVDSIRGIPLGDSITMAFYRGRQKQIVQVPLLSVGMIAGNANANQGLGMNAEMLTPEYVASLHQEIQRLQQEVADLQAKLADKQP